MPNRILKESICTSDQISQLSWFEEALFYRLIVNADDYGRFEGRVPIIRSRLFPLKDVRDKQIEDALAALSSVELVEVYVVDGKPFVRLTGWDRHQAIRAKKSKYPSPEDANNAHASASICNQMHANVSVIQSESESESKSESNASKVAKARFAPPTAAQVEAFCTENKIRSVDAKRFVDFYASKGWKVGNTPMKDWHAAVRNWAGRDSTQQYSRIGKGAFHEYTQRNYTEEDLNFGAKEILEEAEAYAAR